ncbi:hypothetical protein B0H16DRAFT_1689084 [Mycena metata]|uniref:F-box domain-containing protein n=1 Tax=Mycena metata TaxID=1033252 RepID=A0AAD7NGP2_9AGAR|nr:hypothetical protein B0H16DRAFT_1689084 [Mycena metata]
MTDSESSRLCSGCSTTLAELDSVLKQPLISSPTPNEILETNHPPIESQLPSIRDFISTGRARMRVLNAKFAALRSSNCSIEALQSSIDKLLALDVEIRKHKGAISPLRRMPTEVLSLIFTSTISQHGITESAPWTVSAVCARWRATVIYQPRFWTFINLGYFSRSSTHYLRLEIQLQRSGELPLAVQCSSKDTSHFGSPELRLLRLVCEHARRWGKLSVSGSSYLYSQIVDFVQDRLVLLQELEIEVECPAYEGNLPALDIFQDAPLLQRVVLNQKTWPYPVLGMTLPWSQLVQYGASNSWDGHLHALASAANLVECSLEIQGSGQPPGASILLPHLLRLSLSHPTFLECLETPALIELYCDYAPLLLPFLRRNLCKLKTLTLSHCYKNPADDSDLVHIVEEVPTIVNLGLLPGLSFPIELSDTLSSRPDVAPALECISTVIGTGNDIDKDRYEHFARAIDSLWRHGRLRSVKLCPDYGFSLPTIDSIELLRAQGLEFLITEGDYQIFYEDVLPSQFQINTNKDYNPHEIWYDSDDDF